MYVRMYVQVDGRAQLHTALLLLLAFSRLWHLLLLLLLLLHWHCLLCKALSHTSHVRHILLSTHSDARALTAVQLPAQTDKQTHNGRERPTEGRKAQR